MLLHLRNVLTPAEVERARALLGPGAAWVDGRGSAGGQAAERKNNQQLAQDSPAAAPLRELVRAGLQRDPVFFSAALPRKIFNPMFNRHAGGQNHYGQHVDAGVLHSRDPDQWVRTDLSCTLFLADPATYEGGELVLHEPQGQQRFKLPAGDLLLYPGSLLHEVAPVTRGERIASFFWVESMVRGAEQRRLLFEMDMALLKLRGRADDNAVTRLTGTYHNLLRMWADA